MKAFSSRIAGVAAAGTLAVTALVGVSAPAQADAAACTAYLAAQNQSSAARTQVCQVTETLAKSVPPALAKAVCQFVMALTGLPAATATEACTRAVAAATPTRTH